MLRTSIASSMALEPFVDAAGAGEFLKLHPATVQRLAREGTLPGHPVTRGKRRKWRFLLSELKDWLSSKSISGREKLKQKPRKRKASQVVVPETEWNPLAPASKAKIRNLLSVPFNHAIRWEFTDRNPICGPNRGAGVRQSSRRQNVPDILEVSEMQAILAELQLRERVLLFLDMATGLRRGELTGIQWGDIDFENLLIDVQRSVVNQVVGRCKTEASQKALPLDEFTAQDLLAWYRETPYRNPDDWVFASNSSRAGKKRGKQPLWLSSIMRYHIQPIVKTLGINKRVS